MKTLIVGDSHALALAIPAKGRDDVEVGFVGPGSVLNRLIKDKAPSAEFQKMLLPADRRALIIGNEVYNGLCTRLPSETEVMDEFDILGTEETNIRPCLLISQKLIKESLRLRLTALKEALKVVPMDALISGPPPTRDEAMMKAAYASRNIASVMIAPAHIRRLCWQIQTVVIAEIATEVGVPFITPPSHVFDGDGFLAEPYTIDGFHGNGAYGGVILEHVLEIMSK